MDTEHLKGLCFAVSLRVIYQGRNLTRAAHGRRQRLQRLEDLQQSRKRTLASQPPDGVVSKAAKPAVSSQPSFLGDSNESDEDDDEEDEDAFGWRAKRL